MLCFVLPALFVALPLAADSPGSESEASARWLPEACLHAALDLTDVEEAPEVDESADARWNWHYRQAREAFTARDSTQAEAHLCSALSVARGFDRGDLRFAETLDELGLVGWLRRDYAFAEAAQGAAVAEILLALGPPADDLTREERDLCRSSLSTYLTRLGWILNRQGRAEEVEALRQRPYRVLGMGYVPAEAIEDRLTWLVSRYLLIEDLEAADWLTDLGRELQND